MSNKTATLKMLLKNSLTIVWLLKGNYKEIKVSLNVFCLLLTSGIFFIEKGIIFALNRRLSCDTDH